MENTENTIEKKSKKIIEFFKKNSKWIILIVGLILFFVILEDVLDEEIHEFDNAVYSVVSKYIKDPITTIAKIIDDTEDGIKVRVLAEQKTEFTVEHVADNGETDLLVIQVKTP